jgi:dipeptidyl aminopeptidase/acylaminoacyl peptidase
VSQGVLYFVNDLDGRIYTRDTPLTQPGVRFGDLLLSPHGLVAVAERHEGGAVENFLALIDVRTGRVQTLDSGHDFYASPALSPDGAQLAWLTWDAPHMPWDEAALWSASLADGRLGRKERVAGGSNVSILQPQWSPQGVLTYISDASGWWNLYQEGRNICPMEAECGAPLWQLGQSSYAFAGDKIVCAYAQQGLWSLGVVDAARKTLQRLPIEGVFFAQVRAASRFAACIRGTETAPKSVVRIDLETGACLDLGERTGSPISVSRCRPLSFPSAQGRTAYGFYHPPHNPDYAVLSGELPPLLVRCHGGPTSAASAAFEWSTHYWTSRGFAVLDVNYAGSAGYGRTYRASLNGAWGIADWQDAEAGARYLVAQKLADPARLAITGGSAGGYTALCALAFGSLFAACASYYGVSDLSLLAASTHKFEAHYLNTLIGSPSLYESRSPAHFPERFSRPVIFFQGEEDRVVPPNQAQVMYDALRSRGIFTELILYPGEQHGFRQAPHIQDALERELAFYLKVFHICIPE